MDKKYIGVNIDWLANTANLRQLQAWHVMWNKKSRPEMHTYFLHT